MEEINQEIKPKSNKKTIIVSVIFSILVLSGIFYYISSKLTPPQIPIQSVIEQQPESKEIEQPTMPSVKLPEKIIELDEYKSKPNVVRIEPNTKVIWVNEGKKDNYVESSNQPDILNSGKMESGDVFEYVFSEPDIYYYTNPKSPWIKGAVIVEGDISKDPIQKHNLTLGKNYRG